MNTKHTKGEHHAVNYGGYVTMQSTPNYDDNPINLLNEEECQQAEENGKLYAAAPFMISTIMFCYLELQKKTRNDCTFAIQTDGIRAQLRNAISEATGIDAQQVQEDFENEALKSS
jgi:hypothetical protein